MFFEANVSISFPFIDLILKLLVGSPSQSGKHGKANDVMHEVWHSPSGFWSVFMFQEDSTTFLALSNSISCLPEENGKKLDISMKELFYWSSAIPQ